MSDVEYYFDIFSIFWRKYLYCFHIIYTILLQCSHNIFTIFSRYFHDIFHDIYTIFPRYFYDILRYFGWTKSTCHRHSVGSSNRDKVVCPLHSTTGAIVLITVCTVCAFLLLIFTYTFNTHTFDIVMRPILTWEITPKSFFCNIFPFFLNFFLKKLPLNSWGVKHFDENPGRNDSQVKHFGPYFQFLHSALWVFIWLLKLPSKKMQSHTGCSCLKFCHCVFSNVFSSCFVWKMLSHTGCT